MLEAKLMKILQHQHTEMGKTVRDVLQKKHGIPMEVVIEPVRVGQGFTFSSAHVGLWRYQRPSCGEYVWLIEIEHYAPPDAQWWDTWVVDQEPTMQQIIEISARALKAGDEVSSNNS